MEILEFLYYRLQKMILYRQNWTSVAMGISYSVYFEIQNSIVWIT